MKTLRILIFFVAALSFSSSHAFELTLGGQVGALGLAEGKSDSDLGYGAFVQASALSVLNLQLDYMTASINKTDVNALVPNLVWNIVNFDELRVGLLAGPGFYELGDEPWRFGLTGGAFGEVTFIPNLPIGLQARYHSVLSGKDNDLWSVFMTVGYRFNLLGGGDGW